MTTSTLQAVTYTGRDTPFVDRHYRSGLTFEQGQTRLLPLQLAARFLRHADVFQPGSTVDAVPVECVVDDTQHQLEKAALQESEARERDNARYALHLQLDSLDKQGLRDFTKLNFKQDMHPNLGLDKMRERAKGLVDQYGMP